MCDEMWADVRGCGEQMCKDPHTYGRGSGGSDLSVRAGHKDPDLRSKDARSRYVKSRDVKRCEEQSFEEQI